MQKFTKSAGAVVLASILAFGLAGCGSQYDDKVVGTWDWSLMGTTIQVVVNKDGSGSLQGPGGARKFTWRIQRGNNFVFSEGGKDSGFLIESADENTITGSDPQAPGQKIVWTRKK